jgi:hypothetical protein
VIAGLRWLDSSDAERRRALDVVDLLREDGTVDELGIGVIRDAVADRLFPGTSTIQTRVRYFLFIPWLLCDLRRSDAPEVRFFRVLRQRQDQLRRSLMSGGEKTGVIGFRAGRDVKRLPSSVYWHGLWRWGVLRVPGSERDFARSLARRSSPAARLLNDDREPVDGGELEAWDPEMPGPPVGWLSKTTFRLTAEEAAYLEHRIGVGAPDSLLALLVHRNCDPGDARFPWESVRAVELPAALALAVEHARCLSETMHGAALLYNLLLAEEKRGADLVESYRNHLASWWVGLRGRWDAIVAWDLAVLFGVLASWGARVSARTRGFVESWVATARHARRIEDILEDRATREMIRARERSLKGPRARLGNARALDLWQGSSGTARLDYRWGDFVRGMLLDLLQAKRIGG